MVFEIPTKDISSQLVLGSKSTKKFEHELRTYVSALLSLGLSAEDSSQARRDPATLAPPEVTDTAEERRGSGVGKLNLNQIARLANFELPLLSIESRNDLSQQVTERFKNFEGLKLPGEDTFRAGLSEGKQEELSDSRQGMLSHRSAAWLNEILRTANFAKPEPEEDPHSARQSLAPFQLPLPDSCSLRYSDTASFLPPCRTADKLATSGLQTGAGQLDEDSLHLLSKDANQMTAAPTAESLHPVSSTSKIKRLPEKTVQNPQTPASKSGSKYAKPFKDASSKKRPTKPAQDTQRLPAAAAEDKPVARKLEDSFL